MSALSEALRARFEHEGYLAPIDAMSAERAAGYRERVLGLTRRGAGPGPEARTNSHLRYTWAAELVTLPPVLKAVTSLLGPDLLVWRASFFFKSGQDPAFVAWHQDLVYWELEGDALATAWIALTDSNEGNGCVRVIPGSHRAPPLPHAPRLDKDNVLVRGQAVAVAVDEAEARPLVLRAGQFSVHHGGILHSSQENRSGAPRIGFAVRYVGARVKPRGARQVAVLVHGEDRAGHFDLQPLPRYEGDPRARRGHARAMREMVVQMLRQLREQSWRDAIATLVRYARRPGTWRAALRALTGR